jgi:membrane-bound lytic murein transglycosylase A
MMADATPANDVTRLGPRIAAAAFGCLIATTALARPAHHAETAAKPFNIRNAQLEPLPFDSIAGWTSDNHAEAFTAFLGSCRVILRSNGKARQGQPALYRALYEVCERANRAGTLDADAARGFFERNFTAVRLAPLGERDGFFTGYYEPVVEGSRTPSDVYNVPLYRRPPDLLMQRLRRHRAPKGKAAWRGRRPKAAPYFDRAQIEDGALAGRGLEICYLKDPIDAFFAQIQGSVRVRLDDGSMIRLNYDAANGQPYTAVGKFLIERKIIAREDMSMQRIREWMEANPEEGKALRRENKSYVFFRETPLAPHEEAIGAQGISLTTRRSIAVDKAIHVYGTPFFIDAELPIASDKPDTPFRRLMIAQDTGGAIVGPARADIYFGSGEDAEQIAGRLKHFGRFVMLVPKALDPARAAHGIPLPRAKPAALARAAREALKHMADQQPTGGHTQTAMDDRNADATGAPGASVDTTADLSAAKAVPLPRARAVPKQ